MVLGRIACRYGMTPAHCFHNKSQKATKKDTRLAFVSQKERRSTKAATLVDRPTESYRVFFCFQVFDRVFFCAKLPTFMGVFFLLLVTFLFERSAINDALVTSILRSVDPADVVSLSLSFSLLICFCPSSFLVLPLSLFSSSFCHLEPPSQREREKERSADRWNRVRSDQRMRDIEKKQTIGCGQKNKQKWNANRTSIKERLFFFLLETDRGQRFDDCFFFCVFGFSEDLARVFGRRQLGDADRWGRRGAIELTASPPGRSVLFLFVFFLFSFCVSWRSVVGDGPWPFAGAVPGLGFRLASRRVGVASCGTTGDCQFRLRLALRRIGFSFAVPPK